MFAGEIKIWCLDMDLRPNLVQFFVNNLILPRPRDQVLWKNKIMYLFLKKNESQ